MWWFHPWCADTKKMSYNDSALYVAETNRKNRLKAPLKAFVRVQLEFYRFTYMSVAAIALC
jgi:hypothetical protein